MTAHIRHGFGSVRPYLYGPVSLLNFVVEVFGAEEVERHEFGPESYHVEMKIGDSMVVIEAGELPDEIKAWTNSIYAYVQDVDAVYEKALQLGATSIAEPREKPYQERQAGFRDHAGNTWWIGRYRGA